MKPTLTTGVSRVSRIVIDTERTISFMGEDGRVYATPSFVRDIEHACRDLILEHADTGEDSVGMEIAVRHTAPTLPGMSVEIVATVAAIDGRKIGFSVTAKDDVETIGEGTHTRFVVDVAKTVERLKGKRAKLKAA